jgi:hypothetical protein
MFEDRTLKRHKSIGVFVVYIVTGSSMLISPSKSRDLADENNKILTEWKWFETTDVATIICLKYLFYLDILEDLQKENIIIDIVWIVLYTFIVCLSILYKNYFIDIIKFLHILIHVINFLSCDGSIQQFICELNQYDSHCHS